MSLAAISWAKSQKTGSPTLKAVLMAVADYADENGRAWPSQSKLSEDTELSERAVRGALADLAEKGLLQKEARRRADGSRSTDILVIPCNRQQVPPPRQDVPEQPAPRSAPPAAGAGLTTFEPPANRQENRTPTRETRKRAARSNGTRLPDDWYPKDRHYRKAFENGHGLPWVNFRADSMRSWAKANGNRAITLKADWDAAFDNWMAKDFGHGNGTGSRKASAGEVRMAAMFAASGGLPDDRDIPPEDPGEPSAYRSAAGGGYGASGRPFLLSGPR